MSALIRPKLKSNVWIVFDFHFYQFRAKNWSIDYIVERQLAKCYFRITFSNPLTDWIYIHYEEYVFNKSPYVQKPKYTHKMVEGVLKLSTIDWQTKPSHRCLCTLRQWANVKLCVVAIEIKWKSIMQNTILRKFPPRFTAWSSNSVHMTHPNFSR